MFAVINNVFAAEIPALMSCNPIVYLRVRVADGRTDDVWKNRVRKWTNASIDKKLKSTQKTKLIRRLSTRNSMLEISRY